MASLTQPHWECISPVLRNVFLEVGKQTFARRFYLAGGTALGLQLGHRLSMDLDFFSTNDELITHGQQKYPDYRDFGMVSLTALTDFVVADAGLEIQTTPSIRWNDARNFFKREARRIGQQWFSQ